MSDDEGTWVTERWTYSGLAQGMTNITRVATPALSAQAWRASRRSITSAAVTPCGTSRSARG